MTQQTMRVVLILLTLFIVLKKISASEISGDFQQPVRLVDHEEAHRVMDEVRNDFIQLKESMPGRDGLATRGYNFLTSSLLKIFNVIDPLTVICKTFRLQKPSVCDEMIENVKDEIQYIRTHTKLNSLEMCGILMGTQCYRGESEKIFWELEMPPKVRKSHRQPNNSSWTETKFVHLTDLHLDELFEPGSNAKCNEPLCCRHGQVADSIDFRAWEWADYRTCDASPKVLSDTLADVHQRVPNAWFWLWTGDTVTHNVWSVTRHQVLETIDQATKHFEVYRSKGVNIFPSLGNHEAVAINSFAPPNLTGYYDPSWVFSYAADRWSKFLPEHALATFRKAGHYRVRLSDNIVLLNLNSNYCTRLNFWTYYDSVDPGNQLEWLRDELFKAELRGEKAHLVMHVPVDNTECTQGWVYNYLNIVRRFKDTIAGQYAGHTHRDEFRVQYSNTDEKPVGVQFVAPVITSYSSNNPGYRVYTVKNTGELIDYETIYVNLTAAEDQHQPLFDKLYDARSFYKMKKPTFDEFDSLLKHITDNDMAFENYFRTVFVSQSDYSSLQSCDDYCRRALLSSHTVDNPYVRQPPFPSWVY